MLKWSNRILVFLLIGVVVNVAVAWGCAWVHHGIKCDFNESWTTKNGVTLYLKTDSRFGYFIVNNAHVTNREMARSIQENCAKYVGRMWWPDETTYAGGQVCAGWPMPALSTTVISTVRQDRMGFESRIEHGLVWDESTLGPLIAGAPIPAIFPYRPLAVGFTANAVIYAALVAILIHGLVRLRRSMRTRSGRCAVCGYPRGTSSVCTECGELLPVLTVRGTSTRA